MLKTETALAFRAPATAAGFTLRRTIPRRAPASQRDERPAGKVAPLQRARMFFADMRDEFRAVIDFVCCLMLAQTMLVNVFANHWIGLRSSGVAFCVSLRSRARLGAATGAFYQALSASQALRRYPIQLRGVV